MDIQVAAQELLRVLAYPKFGLFQAQAVAISTLHLRYVKQAEYS